MAVHNDWNTGDTITATRLNDAEIESVWCKQSIPFIRLQGTEGSGQDIRIAENAGSILIDDNTNTEASPTWTNRITIDIDTGNITTVGTVDGVDIPSHRSRHDTGGADAIAALAASVITSGTLTHERGGIEADISAIVKGGLLTGTGTNTIGIKGVGGDDAVLTAASGEAGGVTWAAAGGGDGDINIKNISEYYQDFLQKNLPADVLAAGTNAKQDDPNGAWRITNGTVSIGDGTSGHHPYLISKNPHLTARAARVQDSSHDWFIGFASDPTYSVSHVARIHCGANDTSQQYRTAAGASETNTAGSETIDSNYHNWEVQTTGGNTVIFKIDDTTKATHTTNLPTDQMVWSFKNNQAINGYLDAIEITQER